jgi:hypothetical protein
MSIRPFDEAVESVDRYVQTPYEDEGDSVEARYRAVSAPAALSLAFGVLSFLTVFNWFFGLIPAAGVILGMRALRQIQRSPEEIQGRGLACAGLALSAVLWILGATGLAAMQRHAIPPGYEPVTFAELRPDKGNKEALSRKAVELDGRRVFIKGYMYPGRQVFNIKQFVMVANRQLCKFCISNITPTQMVRVEMVGDLTADYKTHLTATGGILHVDRKVVPGQSPYLLEADVFR